MSIPASISAVGAINTMAALSPFDSILQIFNTNPYFIGITMLLMNLGGRFLTLEVSKQQEQVLQHPWVRRSLIFIVIFMGTRSIWVAFWTTLVVILCMGYLFNENSSMCIFGQGGTKGSTCSSEQKYDMTPEEKEILMRLTAKSQRLQASAKNTSEEDVSHTDVYTANMSLLRR